MEKSDEATDGALERVLDHLGLGRWSIIHIAAACIAHAVIGMQTVIGAFVAPVVKYTCVTPNNATFTYDHLYNDQHQQHNLSTSLYIERDQCSYLVNGTDMDQEEWPCTEWVFDNSSFASTLTSEFSLVCGRAYLVPVYQSLYMVGCGTGSIIGGILSDKYGRKVVASFGMVMFILMGACPSWLPYLPLIYLARLLLGVLHMVTLQSVYVLAMETVPSWARAVTGMIVAVPWALSLCILSGLGYLFREWQDLTMISSLPWLAILPIFLFINESPHWLMVHGKEEELVHVLNRAATLHQVVVPDAYIDKVKSEMEDKVKALRKTEEEMSVWKKLKNKILDLLVLFKTPRLRLHTLVICVDFFTASAVYFSLSLGAVNFSADPYIYMAFSGLAEVPSYTVTGPLLAWLGRKIPAIASFLFTGIALLILPAIPSDMWQVNMTVALLGKMTISAVFVELFLYASEVFPTIVRIQGLGTGLLFSRIGSMVSPFFNDLLVPIFPLAMPIVVGGLSILAGLLSCLLPETKGANLPKLVTEIEG